MTQYNTQCPVCLLRFEDCGPLYDSEVFGYACTDCLEREGEKPGLECLPECEPEHEPEDNMEVTV